MRTSASRAVLLLAASLGAGCVTLDPPPVRNEVLVSLRTPRYPWSAHVEQAAAFRDLHHLAAAGVPPEEGVERRAIVWSTRDDVIALGAAGLSYQGEGSDIPRVYRLEFPGPPPPWTEADLPVIWIRLLAATGSEPLSWEYVVLREEGSGCFCVFHWIRDGEGARPGEKVGKFTRGRMAGGAPWILEMSVPRPWERPTP